MAAISVSDEPSEVPGVAGTANEYLLQNLGPDPVYVGRKAEVSDTSGLLLDVDGVLSTGNGLADRNTAGLWLVCATGGSADVRVLRTN